MFNSRYYVMACYGFRATSRTCNRTKINRPASTHDFSSFYFFFLYFFGLKILFCDFLTHVGPSLLCLLSWIATKAFSSYILLVVDYISRWTARAPSLPSLACALFTNIFYFDTTKQKNSIFKIKEIYGVYHAWNNSGLRYDCYVRRIIMTSRVDNSLKYVRVGSSK